MSSLKGRIYSTINRLPSSLYVPESDCHDYRLGLVEANVVQEPRKSDAPQLRDEYRTYKILVGCRKCFRPPSEGRADSS